MGILDGLSLPKSLPNCKVRSTLASLEPADKEILSAALANPAWKAQTLSDALLNRGIALDGKLITRHRQELCSCKALEGQEC